MDYQQRKNQGAFYTKLNVTEMMREMINKHIFIENYYIWDPCCGTGNLFRDRNGKVFDFIDKEKVFLSDIDSSALLECKKDFNSENCFQYNYQNTIVNKFTNMPSKLKKIIKEHPKDLFIVCNPPYLGGSMVRLEGAYDRIYNILYKYAKEND